MPRKVAVIVPVPVNVPADVIRKEAFISFTPSVTDSGTGSPMLLEVSPTTDAVALVAVSVTVQVSARPATRVCWEQVRSSSADAAGDSAIAVESVLAPAVARRVAVCTVDGDPAVIVKFAAPEPAATVTEDGTVSATPASAEIATTRPPAGA